MVRQKVARIIVTTGLCFTGGGWAIDVATCPGEVERASHEIPVIYCDEHPDTDDWVNSPDTLPQKILYSGLAISGVGLIMSRRKPGIQADPSVVLTS